MTKAAAETPDAPAETQDGPLLDLTDSTVKAMIKAAKKRGYVTHDELNKVLPSEEYSSEQIEDILAQLSEMGITVVDSEDDVESDEPAAEEGEEDDDEARPRAVAKKAKSEVAGQNTTSAQDRTDDSVRMYLREMGTVELLSREGEIAIAKRIEAGRNAMIRGLCESPLTFEAIMVCRDELQSGQVLLRDIIDLDATLGGIRGVAAAAETADSDDDSDSEGDDAAAKPAGEAGTADAKKTDGDSDSEDDGDGEKTGRESTDDDDDEDDGANMSLAAMEAELRDGVMVTLDAIAVDFDAFRRLQDKLVALRVAGKDLSAKDRETYDGVFERIVANLNSLHLTMRVSRRWSNSSTPSTSVWWVWKASCCAWPKPMACRAATSWRSIRAMSWIRPGWMTPMAARRPGRASFSARPAKPARSAMKFPRWRRNQACRWMISAASSPPSRRVRARRASPRRKWSRPICAW